MMKEKLVTSHFPPIWISPLVTAICGDGGGMVAAFSADRGGERRQQRRRGLANVPHLLPHNYHQHYE